MKSLFVVAALAACGGKQPPPSEPTSPTAPVGPVTDSRSEFEKRLDAACKALEPKVVSCTVDDAKAAHAAGNLTKAQLDEITKPPILAKLADEWEEKCDKRDRSSRQLRVLEVCYREEKECAPLMDCLLYVDNPNPTP
ncbi:MAG: hypothetical protein SFX73_38615 [Kofleriaceae bacterium]|nr:hypothetical protein [Kofleriaceae bacterium]